MLSRADGALVTFRGVIRDHDAGHAVERLDYSAHPDAEAFLRATCERVAASTGLDGRGGAPDRARSRSATSPSSPRSRRRTAPRRSPPAPRLIDTIKAEVPIWKRQHSPDGTTEWVGL